MARPRRPVTHTTPDGPYGWVVVTCVFLLNIHFALNYTVLSVYMQELAEVFDVSQAAIGTLGAVELALMFISGMLSGAVPVFTCRSVCVTGVILSTVGFVLAAYCTNFTAFVFGFGVLRGTGYGLLMISPTVLIQQYFKAQRARAVGIAPAGLSVGTLTTAPLHRLALDTFGWRGGLVAAAALSAQLTVFAALLRPPDKGHLDLLQEEATPNVGADVIVVGEGWNSKQDKTNGTEEDVTVMKTYKEFEVHEEVLCNSKPAEDDSIGFCMEDTYNSHNSLNEKNNNTCLTGQKSTTPATLKRSATTSVMDTPIASIIDSANTSPDSSVTTQPLVALPNVPHSSQLWSQVRGLLGNWPGVLCVSTTWTLMAANAGSELVTGTWYKFTVDRSVHYGMVPLTASFLLSAIGCMSTASRLLCGIVADSPHINRILLYSGAAAVSGLVGLASTLLVGSIPGDFTLQALFGACLGCYDSLYPTVVGDVMGLGAVSAGMAINMCVAALTTLTLMPLVGLLFDITGSYMASFVMVSGMQLVGAAMGVVTYRLTQAKQTRTISKVIQLDSNTTNIDTN